MEEQFLIRRALKEDIPALLQLLVQVNLVHHLGRPDLFRRATKYGPDELAALLRREDKPVFVGQDGEGRILGHAFCALLETPADDRLLEPVKTLYIDDICVDESARGRRVGTALCRRVLAFARAEGCHNVTLNVWACNPGALRFYERMGFGIQKTSMEVLL